MRRREFLALAGIAATFPRIAFGQQAARVPHIAFLDIPPTDTQMEAFRQGLADFGYVDGRNIAVDLFIAPTTSDIPAMAAKAVASKPDVIVALGAPAPVAAEALTTTIPIVFTAINDPLGLGLIPSLAHPGGNLTGNMNMAPQVVGKQFQIIREIIPSLDRIAVFTLPVNQANAQIVVEVGAAADALKISPIMIAVKEGDDFSVLLANGVAAGAQALYIPALQYFLDNAAPLAALAIQNLLPAICTNKAGAEGGYLVGYGADGSLMVRRSVYYVDRLLKGDNPGILAVEQPTAFDFAVNLKTAKALGLKVPASVIAQATEVIPETAQ